MYLNTDHILNLLKSEVITKSGLKSIMPADCKALSVLISHATKHYLSETTLKRLYGFALSQFQPSLFTKNILSEYCGYVSWSEYMDANVIKKLSGKEITSWDQLKLSVDKVTTLTLQALKNRSGIPYNYTIPRASVNDHLTDFSQSGHTATVIAAPSGYGKTVALCHWVENELSTDDIVLLFSSTALMSALQSSKDISAWMQSLLGYNTEINLEAFENGISNNKFYLIIDGLDEHMFKKDQFTVILNQLLDVMSIYQKYEWFKIVLTLRPDTYNNYWQQLQTNAADWYNAFNNTERINFPLFSITEIKTLAGKINPHDAAKMPAESALTLQHPLLFQFYYKKYRDNFSLGHTNRTTLYELNAIYILNKVYMGTHAEEKVILIKQLIEGMDLSNECYEVQKIKVNSLVKQYANAYHELVTSGILEEFNESSTYNFCTCVKFASDEFLTYNIAKALLQDNDNKFDRALFQYVNQRMGNNKLKQDVLKWCIIYAVKTRQYEGYAYLEDTMLSLNEKSELILFISDLFQTEMISLPDGEVMKNFFRQELNEKLFDYFFGLELITPEYKNALNTLLRFDLPADKKIIVYTALAIVAVINLNLEDLRGCIAKLRTFDVFDHQKFAVDPLLCLETIYHYFTFGEIMEPGLAKLTRIMFNPPEDEYNLKNCAANDMLYILGMHTLICCDNPKKVLRMAGALNIFYKDVNKEPEVSPYRFFVEVIKGDSYYKLQQYDKVKEIHTTVAKAYKKNESALSPYMKAVFHCLKIKVLIGAARQDQILHEMRCIDSITNQFGNRFSSFYTASMLLKDEKALEDYPNFRKQLMYDYRKLVRTTALSESFLI